MLGGLAREQLLYPDQAAEVLGGWVQLTHQEAKSQTVDVFGQSHLLNIFLGFWRRRQGSEAIVIRSKVGQKKQMWGDKGQMKPKQ